MITKTNLTLIILLSLIAAIPSTAMAGRYDQAYGLKDGHYEHYDKHYRGHIHPRHNYKQQRRHKYSHKHHFYYPQLSGHFKRKHRQNRYHYRYKPYYPQPRFIQ